jgi:hypothetical protein
MRLSQAFRVFFRILRDAEFAETVAQAERPALAAPAPKEEKKAGRSEAVALLAALQREGRLVDFLQEPIDSYSDAQVGSAVREVHRACGKALERMFGLQPVMNSPEGSQVRVEKGYDPGRIRLVGQVTGAPPHSGVLAHPGWEATRCDLPEWTGDDNSARVIAPAEVEIR